MAARVSIELDEKLLADAISELELKNAPTFTLNDSGRSHAEHERVRGVYHPATNHITITSQGESYTREGLYVLTKHVRFTVLHELRHAWQREHWSPEQQRLGAAGDYADRIEEQDANAWADYASPKYRGLVVITRTPVGKSGFARLSERAVS